MSERAVHQFIAAVSLHFPRPKFDGDEMMQRGWMKSMDNLLGQYADDVLASAANRIICDRTAKDGRFFPIPSEIREICNDIVQQKRAYETPLLTSAKQEMPYHARVNLARDLMKCPLGQQAKREGWDTTMYHFCVENMRAPNGQEVNECKRKAKQFAADYQRLLKEEHPFGGPLARLADSMVRKARELMGASA